LFLSNAWAQDNEEILDTIKVKNTYGLRIGIDMSRPIIQFAQKQDIGFEITADYRVTTNWYAAAEFGYESEPGLEEYIDFHTKGSYAKLGFNYNAYENWRGMSNEVYVGLRYGYSSFEQQLNSFTALDFDNYFGDNTTAPERVYSSLSAHWAELHFGLKVEILQNLYLTGGIHFNKLISSTEPEGFANLYIPGFDKVQLNKTGVGFNYTIAYLIPIRKK
jgi:hypothetical protein